MEGGDTPAPPMDRWCLHIDIYHIRLTGYVTEQLCCRNHQQENLLYKIHLCVFQDSLRRKISKFRSATEYMSLPALS